MENNPLTISIEPKRPEVLDGSIHPVRSGCRHSQSPAVFWLTHPRVEVFKFLSYKLVTHPHTNSFLTLCGDGSQGGIDAPHPLHPDLDNQLWSKWG